MVERREADNAPDMHKALATEDLAATSGPDGLWHAAGEPNGSANSHPDEEPTALLSPDESGRLRKEWDRIQTGFVDAPREAVRDADRLVDEATKRLAESFASQRAALEKGWDSGSENSTEELRLALKRYRSFFNRLLAI